MIDLHNHILPGLDDGAAHLKESLDIARQFVSEGVTRVAATPHLDPERGNGAPAPVVREKVAQVRAAVEDVGLNLDVLPGHELYLVPEAPDLLRAGDVSTLGDGRFVLVELSLVSGERPLYLDDTIFRLQLDGYSVILAHPERYGFVQRNVAALDELVGRGVALQATAPALLGEYGGGIRRAAERLLRRGSYSLASSDRHHPGPARSLAQTHERIRSLTNVDTADLLLCGNPARVLDDRPLQEPDVNADERSSFFGRLFSRR
jgi:protein-tyrosine phosphatase